MLTEVVTEVPNPLNGFLIFATNNLYALKIIDFLPAPVKGAQVLKVGRYQRWLSQKPRFVVVFFLSLPLASL